MFDPSQVRSTLGNADLKEDIEALYNRIPEIEIPEIDDIKKLFQGIKFTIYKDQWVKDEDYFKVILRHNLKLKLESIDIRFFNTKNESILLDFKYENDDTYLVLYSNVAEDIYIILKQKIESECSGIADVYRYKSFKGKEIVANNSADGLIKNISIHGYTTIVNNEEESVGDICSDSKYSITLQSSCDDRNSNIVFKLDEPLRAGPNNEYYDKIYYDKSSNKYKVSRKVRVEKVSANDKYKNYLTYEEYAADYTRQTGWGTDVFFFVYKYNGQIRMTASGGTVKAVKEENSKVIHFLDANGEHRGSSCTTTYGGNGWYDGAAMKFSFDELIYAKKAAHNTDGSIYFDAITSKPMTTQISQKEEEIFDISINTSSFKSFHGDTNITSLCSIKPNLSLDVLVKFDYTKPEVHIGSEEPEEVDDILWSSNAGNIKHYNSELQKWVISGTTNADEVEIKDKSNNFNSSTVEGALNEIATSLKETFQQVSNGKKLLETTITDKGATVSKVNEIPTFVELSDAIKNITTDDTNHECIEPGRELIYNALISKLPSLVNKITPESPLKDFAFYIMLIGEMLLSFNENISAFTINKNISKNIMVNNLKDLLTVKHMNENFVPPVEVLNSFTFTKNVKKQFNIISIIDDNFEQSHEDEYGSINELCRRLLYKYEYPNTVLFKDDGMYISPITKESSFVEVENITDEGFKTFEFDLEDLTRINNMNRIEVI